MGEAVVLFGAVLNEEYDCGEGTLAVVAEVAEGVPMCTFLGAGLMRGGGQREGQR